ncbi:hypothetical protein EVAR_44217_1 [Eumeta japonica]|uniref:Uncharacterized protein n=1 Tax=Eumeta variegata TaxID=151549 RepID=A0A4C1W2I1_EUMVA|nr:hypothetical protein EVAR_44217_1 [Eumeta japonica]
MPCLAEERRNIDAFIATDSGHSPPNKDKSAQKRFAHASVVYRVHTIDPRDARVRLRSEGLQNVTLQNTSRDSPTRERG